MTHPNDDLFKAYRPRFEQYLGSSLTAKTSTLTAQQLSSLPEATHYGTLNGGKRIRPMLVYMAASCISEHTQQVNQNTALIDAAAAAIELIHCYSLIHDDLPAMDNDNLRRGKPTCHIAYDEATAILAGDGLQALAFEILSDTKLNASTQQLKMLGSLAKAAGITGMVGGQAIDLAATNQPISYEQLVHMHQLKTGALITCAVEFGAIASHASKQQMLALKNYANAIGLAFQVKDDILDIEGNAEVMGKTQGADINANKSTFPSLIGLEAASKQAAQLRDQAIAALQPFGQHAEPLRQLADFFIQRSA